MHCKALHRKVARALFNYISEILLLLMIGELHRPLIIHIPLLCNSCKSLLSMAHSEAINRVQERQAILVLI